MQNLFLQFNRKSREFVLKFRVTLLPRVINILLVRNKAFLNILTTLTENINYLFAVC